MATKILLSERIANLELAVFEGPNVAGDTNRNPNVRNVRVRKSTAEVNAGAELLPAIAGFKYRLIDTTVIAIGGAAATLTLLTISGTQAGAAALLVTHTQASLTRSTVLKPFSSGAVVLADGASFVANDVSTPITIGKTGSDMATATHIDVILTFALEAA